MKNQHKLLVLFVFVLALSCGKSVVDVISTNPQFAEHIAAHTSGIISKKDAIQLQLTQSLVGFDIEVPLKKNPFRFEPAIEGKVEWIDSKTLVFTPASPLKPNTKYVANFDLGSLKDVPEELKTFVFDFHTIKQNFDLSIEGYVTPKSSDYSNTSIEATVSFADVIDTLSLAKGIFAFQNGKELPVRWNKNNEKEYSLWIDGLKRGSESSEVSIRVKGAAFDTEKDKEKKLTLYGINTFVASSIQVKQVPEQYLDILFSDPIDENQSLTGLITLENEQINNYVIDGHHVKVFFGTPQEGSKRLSIYAGIKNTKGKSLKNGLEKNIVFESIQPNVRTIGNGTIMPTSNGLRYPFEAVNLKAVDVTITKVYENNLVQFLQVNELNGNYQLKRVGKKVFTKKMNLEATGANLNQWNKYFIDLAGIIKEDKGALYQVSIKFKKGYVNSVCPVSKEEEEIADVETDVTETEWSEAGWDEYGDDYYYDYDYYYYGDYDYEQRNNPCNPMYYYDKGITANFLLSDIGLIAKAGSDKVLHVYVNDILSTKPLSGVEVVAYNWQQQVIGTVKTNGEGMATISLEEKPFVIIAKSGPQRAYLKLNDGNALSLSKFDVAGVSTTSGVKGFIYGERGVWRPGDSVFLSFMLEDKQAIIPVGHPIECKVFNPRNQLVNRQVGTIGKEEIYDFRFVTNPTAITGTYRAEVAIGSRMFTKYLKIETVKPNRLKIELTTNSDILSPNKNQDLTLQAKWLHGASAGGLKAKVDVSIDQAGTSFKGYESYVFDDPTKRFYANDITLFNGTLNELGEVNIPASLAIDRAAPGMLNAHFFTKVFEQGGAFSVNQTSLKYSPFSSYVGIKIPKGDMYAGTLETKKKYTFDIANVTETGAKASNDIEVKVYKIQWRWWWDNYDGDLSSYISRSSTIPVYTNTVSSSNGKANFTADFTEWGRYLVILKDKQSNHTSGSIFYADEPYWARTNRTDNQFATMLAFSTDKETYEVGEDVKITFPSSEGGRALISIESGAKVISSKWINTEDEVTKDFFKVTPEMAPNVFINITLLQPHENTRNDLPVRMYGVIPIKVENKDSHLEPLITMDEVLRPETTTTIKIKEKDNKSMNYTLAIVDEGLLDLTNYKTPDPWNVFYAREALGIKTWDLYDEIMNAYTLEMDKVLATGGDGELNPDKQSNRANRFKPMVRFLGPFKLKGGTASHKVAVPNYVGSVRVMVIAGDDLRYGKTEKTVPVRNPLMVLGTLPRVVGPQEEISLPVNVFAMEKEVKNVTVTVKTNDKFSLEENSQALTFSKTGDKVVNFTLKTQNKIGVGKVEITVKSGSLVAKDIIELDVRPSNPLVTNVTEYIVQPGETLSEDIVLNGLKGTNKVTLEVSSIAPINLAKRLNYLIQYPHGCIEQTTSSAFPQLYLEDLVDLDKNKKTEIESNVKMALQRLIKFQTLSGGFSYWPGDVETNEWGTIYGAHFIVEAEKKGYALPFGMKNKVVDYLKSQAKVWKKASNKSATYAMYANNDLIQAYRLYVLALSGNADKGAMNRLRETKGLQVTARFRLAGAFQLINQTQAVNELIFNQSTTVKPYQELGYSYGSDIRDEAMILEVLSIIGDKAKAASLAKEISSKMSSDRWMSTQTTAYCLIAMSKFLQNTKTSSVLQFDYALEDKKGTQKASTSIFQISKSVTGTESKVAVKNNGKGVMYVRVLAEGIPLVGEQNPVANNLAMRVVYTGIDGQPLNPLSIPQGTDFKVKVTISNPGTRGDLQELALTQIFPSCWEILNSRMVEAYGASSTTFDYQDIRDDRVYTYFDLRKGETKTFEFNLNATYKGKAYMPSVICEAMYDKSISAVKPGGWVLVE